MGVSKAFLTFHNTTFLQSAIDVFCEIGIPVRLVASPGNRFDDVLLPVLQDRMPGCGPLGAVYTALAESESERCFVLPSDTPLVEADLFRVISEYLQGWDAVVPVDSQNQVHPLSAFYSTRCLEDAETLLNRGERRVGALLEAKRLRVLKLPVSELGIPDVYFFDVNTPEEYDKLLNG
jgi:molybdopterin-guanine dinucleotide biosynthesis protein A